MKKELKDIFIVKADYQKISKKKKKIILELLIDWALLELKKIGYPLV